MNKSILASSQWLDGKIQGKSIKFNQLVQNGDFADVSIWGGAGTYTVSNNVGELSSTGDIRQTISLINGNKYLAIVDVYGKSTNQFLFIQGIGNTRHTNTDDYTWETLSLFFTSSLTSASFRVINNESFYCRFRKYMCFNLTLLFGSGQEPSTLSEFYATDLGKVVQAGKYLPYGSGILNATASYVFKDANDNTLATYSRTSRVDLGSLNWALQNNSFYSYFNLIKNTSTWQTLPVNMVCTKYQTKGFNNLPDKCISYYGGYRLYIKDTDYTDAQSFKNAMSGIYLEYEPATQLELRAVGKDLTSLLGKQNNLQQSGGALYNWLTFSNGYWRYYTTPQVAWNITPLSQNRKYVLISKFNTLEHFRNDVIPISNGNSWNFTVSSEYRANNTIVSIITNSTFTSVITCLRYTNGASLEGTIGEYCILIDLTSIGLDNLTAQQFYDNYNQYFEKLADGQTINTLCDTLWNCSGNVERVLGIVKLKDLPYFKETTTTTQGGVGYRFKAYFDLYKYNSITTVLVNIISNTYRTISARDTWFGDNGIGISGDTGPFINVYDTNYTDVTAFKNHFTDDDVLIYELETPTTEQHPSIAIPKLATKCTDANGMEIDIERNN